jgi:membrane-associated phospholipid phosphatase
MWSRQEQLRFQILWAVAALDAGLYAAGHLRMRWMDLAVPLGASAFLIVGATYFRRCGRRPSLSATLIAVAQITIFAALAAVLNYLLLVFDRPLIDAFLLRLDEAMGVHWLSLFAALKNGPIGRLLTIAYESNGLMLAGTILLLGLGGRIAELDRFLLAFFIATLLTLAFWAFFPSFGAATYLVSTGQVTELPGATVGRNFALVLLALKSGALNEMFLQDLKGLVAFPSLHTVMALLPLYAVRKIRVVFWPALAWAGLMLLSIPVDGGHHVVDLLGGALLAWLAIFAAGRVSLLAARHPARPLFQPIAPGAGSLQIESLAPPRDVAAEA